MLVLVLVAVLVLVLVLVVLVLQPWRPVHEQAHKGKKGRIHNTPPQVNRARWPTEEISKISTFCFWPAQKIAWDGPELGREFFFPANPDLADIFGDTDFNFEIFYF